MKKKTRKEDESKKSPAKPSDYQKWVDIILKPKSIRGGQPMTNHPPDIWEVWQDGSIVCSREMRLSEYSAKNKVENEARHGTIMEARPATWEDRTFNWTELDYDDD